MRSTIFRIATTALAASLSACAVEPEVAEPPAIVPPGPGAATDQPIWAVPEAESATLVSIPEGWTSAHVTGAADNAVILTSAAVPRAPACPTGFACLFQNSNRGGFGYGLRSGFGNRNLLSVRCGSCTNGIHGNNGTFNDQMSSWENRSGRRYCWYFDVGPSGETHPMANGQLINVLPRENDRASAFGPC